MTLPASAFMKSRTPWVVLPKYSGTKAVKLTFVAKMVQLPIVHDNWGVSHPVTGVQIYNLKALLKSDHASGLSGQLKLLLFLSRGGAYMMAVSLIGYGFVLTCKEFRRRVIRLYLK